MQAASRESYAAARQRLDAYAAGAPADRIATTGDEIGLVADLLRREPRLRRALSDPARSGEDRSALLRNLLGDRIGADAKDLLDVLVSGRWSAPSELLEAAERLGVEALLASADRAGELGEVEDELFRFGQVVAANPELSNVLADPIAPVAQRAELTGSLLAGKARQITIKLVEVALSGFGGRSFSGGLTRLVELAADRRDRQVAYVTVAAPLTEEEERRLGATLTELYGREISVKQTVDPAVLGGMSVRIGSDLYDGTILRRLTDTRNALARR
ncbi:F0F1 ATP synthase subunit delta [Micromonospora sp. HM5-17]|jgi:F-type H+-transporting ATPase subunit delta|uniref:F0F1 ATP synthase subunit delta n=1 Tax=Micromonospora sp. HM5-17 TaxID=2487710 RepID=UPI000F4A037D|nr:F0F1 ATP synthase subunit delta [Micromonospora sp. HM5-17]ROT31595.1 F0F1 ATP synthase subunit delta [Micromonospora sp. HM5-17]